MSVHDVELGVELAHRLVEHARRFVRRVVAELRVLHDVVGDIDAEAVDAASQPEAQHVEHRASTSGLRQLRSGCSLRNEWR